MRAHPENFLFSLEGPQYGAHCKVRMTAKFTRCFTIGY